MLAIDHRHSTNLPRTRMKHSTRNTTEVPDDQMLPTAILAMRLCKEAGLKYTRAVRVVIQALVECSTLPNTYDIHRRARKRRYGLALGTTYRILNRLVEAGILVRHDMGDSIARYALRQPTQHSHLVDVADGRVEELSDNRLNARIAEVARGLGYRLVRYRLVMYGEPRLKRRASARRLQVKGLLPEALKATSPVR